jgi:hypothetical protein
MIDLSNRVHMFARPNAKDGLVEFFSNTLECGPPISIEIPGGMIPILVFEFPSGASLSVQFTEEAPEETPVHRGVWLELVTDQPSELEAKILDAGLRPVEYLGSDYFYFQAPGGQVMRIAEMEQAS